MSRLSYLTFLALSPTLGGCWLFGVDQGYQKATLGTDSYWMNYDSTRRGGLLLRGDDTGKVLAEPAPDAIASTTINFLTEVAAKAQEVDAKVQLDYSRAVSEMAGRSQTVLVVREALYRLNELFINGAFGTPPPAPPAGQGTGSPRTSTAPVSPGEVARLYESTINAVVFLAYAAALDEAGIKEALAMQADLVADAEREAAAATRWTEELEAERRIAATASNAEAEARLQRLASTYPDAFRTVEVARAKAALQDQVAAALARATQRKQDAEQAAAAAREQRGKALELAGTAVRAMPRVQQVAESTQQQR